MWKSGENVSKTWWENYTPENYHDIRTPPMFIFHCHFFSDREGGEDIYLNTHMHLEALGKGSLKRILNDEIIPWNQSGILRKSRHLAGRNSRCFNPAVLGFPQRSSACDISSNSATLYISERSMSCLKKWWNVVNINLKIASRMLEWAAEITIAWSGHPFRDSKTGRQKKNKIIINIDASPPAMIRHLKSSCSSFCKSHFFDSMTDSVYWKPSGRFGGIYTRFKGSSCMTSISRKKLMKNCANSPKLGWKVVVINLH